jgi:hypothetical protein
MTHYVDMRARQTGYCDWCRKPIEVGQTITQIRRDVGDPDRVPADPRWFHSRCARQFVADPFW